MGDDNDPQKVCTIVNQSSFLLKIIIRNFSKARYYIPKKEDASIATEVLIVVKMSENRLWSSAEEPPRPDTSRVSQNVQKLFFFTMWFEART